MTEAKKRVPALRFPGFEGEWEEKKMDSFVKFHKGKGISRSDIEQNGKYECIRYGELYTDYGEIIKIILSKTNLPEKTLFFSEPNDIIIPTSGETQIDIATASCVLKKGVALGGDLTVMRTSADGVFLSYYLNSAKKIEIAKLAQGNSVVHLYPEHLSRLYISFPKLAEQQKIAYFLSSVDERIGLLKKKKEQLEAYKPGAIQQIFSRRLQFKDTDGNDYPEWKKYRLGDILEEKTERNNDSKEYRVISSTAKGLFYQDEYFNNVIASNDISSYKVLRYGQLVFSPQNLWLGNININLKYEAGIVSPSYKIFEFNNSLTTARFCDYFLVTPRMIFEYGLSSEQGASIVRRNLNMDLFNSISIVLPGLKEQQKIADFLSAIDDKITLCDKQIAETQTFKKGLLQQMFV